MKKILFPTDFSTTAQNAFVHALEFAKNMQAELLLLHTFELPVFDSQFFPENYSTIFESVELAQFELFKDEIPKLRSIAKERNLEHIRIQHRLMDGDLVTNLKRVIEEEHVDFIVMGTSGLADWSSFFLGSNTEAIISGVSIPVLCIPTEVDYKKTKTIGFTNRYLEQDKKELYKTLEVAKKINAQVRCLYVKQQFSEVSDETIKSWEKEFKNEPVVFSVIPSEDIKETILDFVIYKEIDMLVVVAYKRNFFEALIHPSFSKKIVKDVKIPVMILHEK